MAVIYASLCDTYAELVFLPYDHIGFFDQLDGWLGTILKTFRKVNYHFCRVDIQHDSSYLLTHFVLFLDRMLVHNQACCFWILVNRDDQSVVFD